MDDNIDYGRGRQCKKRVIESESESDGSSVQHVAKAPVIERNVLDNRNTAIVARTRAVRGALSRRQQERLDILQEMNNRKSMLTSNSSILSALEIVESDEEGDNASNDEKVYSSSNSGEEIVAPVTPKENPRVAAAQRRILAFIDPVKYGRRIEEEDYDDEEDIDDFIAQSDEEDDEPVRTSPKKKKSPKPKDCQSQRKSCIVESDEEASTQSPSYASPKIVSDIKTPGSQNKRHNRSKVLLDSDEDDKRSRSTEKSGSSSDSEQESNDESDIDDSTVYWRVNAERDMMEDDLEADIGNLLGGRNKLSRTEAVSVYIQYLTTGLLDSHSARSSKIFGATAARQIENLICTTRESLLGSGAWNHDGFVESLTTKPFYMVTGNAEAGSRCAACGRASSASLPYKIALFGAEYDSAKVWNNPEWLKHMPEEVRNWAQSVESDETDGTEDAEYHRHRSEQGPWWKSTVTSRLNTHDEDTWILSGHCLSRTQSYHTLLHYKLRLCLKILEKLRVYGSDFLSSDQFVSFHSRETDRLNRTLDNAGRKWGSQDAAQGIDAWNDVCKVIAKKKK